jgi:hypothetical protein
VLTRLFTRHAFDGREKARELFSLLNEAPEPFRPARYDVGEPVRRAYNPDDLGEPFELLSGAPEHESGGLLLKGAKYQSLAHYSWVEGEVSSWDIYLGSSFFRQVARVESYLAFVGSLCRAFPVLYGAAADEEDWRAKHWLVTPLPGGGNTETQIRPDLRRCLPGVYWLTHFGPPLVEFFGRSRLARLPVHRVLDLGEAGMTLLLRPSPFQPDLDARLRGDREIIAALASQYFFDIADPTRSCEAIPGVTSGGVMYTAGS